MRNVPILESAINKNVRPRLPRREVIYGRKKWTEKNVIEQIGCLSARCVNFRPPNNPFPTTRGQMCCRVRIASTSCFRQAAIKNLIPFIGLTISWLDRREFRWKKKLSARLSNQRGRSRFGLKLTRPGEAIRHVLIYLAFQLKREKRSQQKNQLKAERFLAESNL